MVDYEALWAEIQANPKCAPHIVPSFPKADEAAQAGDAAIAAILSAGKTRVEPSKLINDGEVAVALGVPGGPMFLHSLEQAAETAPGEDADQDDVVAHAVAHDRHVLRSRRLLAVSADHDVTSIRPPNTFGPDRAEATSPQDVHSSARVQGNAIQRPRRRVPCWPALHLAR